MRLGRLLRALLEQCLELNADLLGLTPELVQELALLVLELLVVEEHLTEPRRLLGADSAVHQDVVLNGIEEELFEAICELPEYGLTRADERLLTLHGPGPLASQ